MYKLLNLAISINLAFSSEISFSIKCPEDLPQALKNFDSKAFGLGLKNWQFNEAIGNQYTFLVKGIDSFNSYINQISKYYKGPEILTKKKAEKLFIYIAADIAQEKYKSLTSLTLIELGNIVKNYIQSQSHEDIKKALEDFKVTSRKEFNYLKKSQPDLVNLILNQSKCFMNLNKEWMLDLDSFFCKVEKESGLHYSIKYFVNEALSLLPELKTIIKDTIPLKCPLI